MSDKHVDWCRCADCRIATVDVVHVGRYEGPHAPMTGKWVCADDCPHPDHGKGSAMTDDLRERVLDVLAPKHNGQRFPIFEWSHEATPTDAEMVELADAVLAAIESLTVERARLVRLEGHATEDAARIDWSCAAHGEGLDCCADRHDVYRLRGES